MKLPRNISAKMLITALEKLGYKKTRQKGSHIRLTTIIDGKEHHLTIPSHDPLKVGTFNNIINELSAVHDMEKSVLLEKLFE